MYSGPPNSQVQPLLSGYRVERATTPGQNVIASAVFPLPFGNAMDNGAQTLRYAPAPELSVWAGIRPSDSYNPLQAPAPTFRMVAEIGIIPYDATESVDAVIGGTRFEPAFTPINPMLSNAFLGTNILNVQGRIAWPVGTVLARVSYINPSAVNPLGPVIDFYVAWAAVTMPTRPAAPIQRGAGPWDPNALQQLQEQG